MINNALINKTYKRYSVLLLTILCVLSVVNKLPNIFRWMNNHEWKYYITPLIWTGLIFWIVVFIPKIHPDIKYAFKLKIYFHALVCAIALFVIRCVVGLLLYELGESPYDLSLRGMWTNFLTVFLPFIGMELIRSYNINSFCKTKNTFMFVLITLITTGINMNISKIYTIQSLEDITVYIAKEVGPTLCMNVALSYFAFYGGANASIIFGGTVLLFHWFFPIMPMLNWLGEGVFGIMLPVIILFYITSKYEKRKQITRLRSRKENKNTIEWFLIMAASIGFLWFVVGVFPIYPTVIVTGSMKPLIDPGDVILISKFHSEEEIMALKEGDIIVFQRDDIMISHRIMEITTDKGGELGFITKGDNNSAEDTRTVKIQDIKGKYVCVIPKIGYPTLWFKSNNMEYREEVEY